MASDLKFMANRHFFKILVTFTAMILFGLLAVFITNYLSEGKGSFFSEDVANIAE